MMESADEVQIRIANEKYLREHPEVKQILNYFIRQVLLERPDDVKDFAADLFGDPDLKQKVEAFMEGKQNIGVDEHPAQ